MSHLDRFGLVSFGVRAALLKWIVLKFHTWSAYYKPLDFCLMKSEYVDMGSKKQEFVLHADSSGNV